MRCCRMQNNFISERTYYINAYKLIRSLQWEIYATIQRETKILPEADNQTTELILHLPDFNNIHKIIKTYRKKHHLTQEELANLMGIKFTAIRSWEQNKTKPPYNVWRQFKGFFE